MKKNALNISLSLIFAALYAVCVVALAPISFSIVQVRVADALLPLSIIFGWPAIIGCAAGAAVANVYGGLGLIDIVGGALANFLATYIAFWIAQKKFRGNWVVAVVAEIAVVTAIVGSYLSYLLATPLAISLAGVFIGTLIATGILGGTILAALQKTTFARSVKQRLGIS
jgi:uncharacterized membrane protein